MPSVESVPSLEPNPARVVAPSRIPETARWPGAMRPGARMIGGDALNTESPKSGISGRETSGIVGAPAEPWTFVVGATLEGTAPPLSIRRLSRIRHPPNRRSSPPNRSVVRNGGPRTGPDPDIPVRIAEVQRESVTHRVLRLATLSESCDWPRSVSLFSSTGGSEAFCAPIE